AAARARGFARLGLAGRWGRRGVTVAEEPRPPDPFATQEPAPAVPALRRAIDGHVLQGLLSVLVAWSITVSPAALAVTSPALAPLARATLPAYAVAITSIGAVASVALLLLAWRLREPERASFAHVAAAASGVAVLTASATVAINRGRRGSSPSRRITAVVV